MFSNRDTTPIDSEIPLLLFVVILEEMTLS